MKFNAMTDETKHLALPEQLKQDLLGNPNLELNFLPIERYEYKMSATLEMD